VLPVTVPKAGAKRIVGDGEQPGAAVGSRSELVPEAVGAQEGLLQEILRFVGIAREIQAGCIDRIHVRQSQRGELCLLA